MKTRHPKPQAAARAVKRQKNYSELLRTARRTSAYAFVAGLGVWLPKAQAATLVNLDSTGLPLGETNSWVNTGALVGDFVIGLGATTNPTVVLVDGVKGMSFLADGGIPGAGSHYVGPIAPNSIAGANPRTIEAWIFNDSPQDAEAIVGWGRRGGDGLNSYLGHGVHTAWGGAEMWGAPDLGWGNTAAAVATNMVFNRWTYIVQSFDGTNNSLYVDGRLANSEGRPATALINTAELDTGGNPIPIRVAREIDDFGGVSGASVGSFVAGRIRVHDAALNAAAIQAQFDAEKGSFNLNDTDTDGMPDWWEVRYGLDKNNPADAGLDADLDGLLNLAEFQRGTNPTNTDTDGDGLADGAEVNRIDPQTTLPAPTNPTDADSDDDGLVDGVETDTGTFVSATNTGTDPLKGDTDGDIASDGTEVACGSNPNAANSTCAGFAPAIKLDATGLAVGPLTNWINTGFIVGNFNVPTNATVPNVTTNDGVRGVQLLAAGGADTGTHYVGPGTIPEVTASNPRTVEAWVLDTLPQGEKIVIAWGKRAGASPDGANFPLGIGTQNDWGAVAAWGTPDIGWNDQEVHGRWTHIAATWDGTTTRLYSEGVLVNQETPTPTINTVHLDTGSNPLPFRIGRQNNEAGGIDATGQGTVNIARVRVYTNAFDAATIRAQFDAEKAFFGLADTDGDGLADWWEIRYGFDKNDATGVNGASGDPDADTLTNAQEFLIGTNPRNADTDGDGLRDDRETRTGVWVSANDTGTNPLNRDTDGDGLVDGAETNTGVFVNSNNTGTNPHVVDTDGDTFSDGLEVSQGSNPTNPLSVPDPGPVLVLNAESLTPGPLTNWLATGVMGGNFATSGAIGVVTNALGVRGVAMTGGYYTGPAAPLTGEPSYSVEAWVLNPAVGGEETILAWGRRGADGLNSSFNHGSNGDYGAMGHWGARDIGWNGAWVQGQGRWAHFVYTFDALSNFQRVYANGVEVNSEDLSTFNPPLNIAGLAIDGVTPMPFRLAAQNADSGAVAGGLRGTMTFGEVKVYTRAVPASEISTIYNNRGNYYGVFDSDNDGMPDWYERQYPAFLNEDSAADGLLDFDGDGLANADEFTNGTTPTNPDTDGDGLTDGNEVNTRLTNPTNADTEYDGLSDGREVALGTNPLAVDSDGDSFFDSHEVLYGSNPNDLNSTPNTSTPRPFVTLDATELPLGPLNVWSNQNTLNWVFRPPTNSPSNVEVVSGTKGVVFPGFATNYYTGPSMPQFFGGNTAWTVEAWILNPAIANEETVFAWGRRGGGPDGSNPAFLHGASTAFGAVGLWGAPDVGWGATAAEVSTNTVVGQWTYVAYTYDPLATSVSVYKDGVPVRTLTRGPLALHSIDPSDPRNPNNFGRLLPFRVAAQSDAGGNPSAPFGSMTIAKVRAYDVAVSAAQIAANYNAERVQFPGQLRITNVRVAPNGFVAFDWVPTPGRTYEVQRNDSVTNANGWSAVGTGLSSGSFTNDPGAAPKYYRLRVEPLP